MLIFRGDQYHWSTPWTRAWPSISCIKYLLRNFCKIFKRTSSRNLQNIRNVPPIFSGISRNWYFNEYQHWTHVLNCESIKYSYGIPEFTKTSYIYIQFKACICPASIYLFQVNNRNTRKTCEICSKLVIKTT